ncbi:MAG: zinc ribbon domain-containing protein [Dehalococcoidia bacterium]|nr:zinc ribbon domain-containing protein [Dehalococcoidia bacterium]
MPVYEYRCQNEKCRRKVSVLVRSLSEPVEVTCSHCGGKNLTRLFSTFARVRTDQDVYGDILDDPVLVNRMMHNDPKALVEWSRRLGGTEGEKTPEYQEMIERLERGESYESVVPEMQKRIMGMESEGGPAPDSSSGEED